MENEEWYKKMWRPALAWVFLAISIFDFIAAPLLAFFFPESTGVKAMIAWEPNLLKHTGLYMWMIAPILGLYVYSRGKEKQEIMKINAARHARPVPQEKTLLNE